VRRHARAFKILPSARRRSGCVNGVQSIRHHAGHKTTYAKNMNCLTGVTTVCHTNWLSSTKSALFLAKNCVSRVRWCRQKQSAVPELPFWQKPSDAIRRELEFRIVFGTLVVPPSSSGRVRREAHSRGNDGLHSDGTSTTVAVIQPELAQIAGDTVTGYSENAHQCFMRMWPEMELQSFDGWSQLSVQNVR